MALENGKCFVFEAFWLRVGVPICEYPIPVVGIAFAKAVNVCMVVAADGTMSFFPWAPA
jgi:hypothetical protein